MSFPTHYSEPDEAIVVADDGTLDRMLESTPRRAGDTSSNVSFVDFPVNLKNATVQTGSGFVGASDVIKMGRIPKILHYTFGMVKDFGGKPWSLVHHVCLKSAVERIAPEQTLFYYEFEPSGPWWELSRELVTPVRIEAPREIFGRSLIYAAHRADVVRLRKLIEHGGIYLDADVFVQRDFNDLLNHQTVLGQEGINAQWGIANAVILAEPQSPFLHRWLEGYHSFRSGPPGSQFWSDHSVRLPVKLARDYPSEITVLPHKAFFWPLWTEEHLEWIFASNKPIPIDQTYANHLWENFAWKYLEDLTPGRVRSVDTNFHLWARPMIDGLPDGLGAPTLRKRLQKHRRQTLQKARALKSHATDRLAAAQRLAAGLIARETARRPPIFRDAMRTKGIPVAVNYDHAKDPNTAGGSAAALSTILGSNVPGSLLDIGCGTGSWLRAALDLGVSNVLGIDGIDIAEELLHVEKTNIKCFDLSKPFDLGRRFDVALCLEVAEHLPECSSNDLVSSIVSHSDSIIFSAACPGQPGQRHVNCQWPIYWQCRFNSQGFACDDSIRWKIWDDTRIQPWYRQNIFWARRDPKSAGREPRLKAVIHPGIAQMMEGEWRSESEYKHYVEQGRMPAAWYVTVPPLAIARKLVKWIYGTKSINNV